MVYTCTQLFLAYFSPKLTDITAEHMGLLLISAYFNFLLDFAKIQRKIHHRWVYGQARALLIPSTEVGGGSELKTKKKPALEWGGVFTYHFEIYLLFNCFFRAAISNKKPDANKNGILSGTLTESANSVDVNTKLSKPALLPPPVPEAIKLNV